VENGRGSFIAIEGDEGAGKTTQVAALIDALSERGVPAQEVREPGGDRFAEEMRQILKYADYPIHPWAEALAFNAARANLLQNVVLPLLEQGVWVISDRCYLSTLVYQGGARQISPQDMFVLRQMCSMGVRGVEPDLLVVLDVSPEVSARRIEERGKLDRLEALGSDYRRRVNQGYRDMARELELPLLDASRSVEAVQEDLLSLVLNCLSERFPWEDGARTAG